MCKRLHNILFFLSFLSENYYFSWKIIYMRKFVLTLIVPLMFSCSQSPKFTGAEGEVKIITLDPGHFHAALVQKSMYPQVNPVVHVYAPEGDELQQHLKKIESYNTRPENPTKWDEKIYTGADFLEKMISEKAGNVVVISGNNQKKTEYIKACVDAGLNVLSDKPMVINSQAFDVLKEAFAVAAKNNVLLLDIMTERNEITTMMQREFSLIPDVFGTLEKGTPENPAVSKISVHHYCKMVSGSPLKRPAWFYDVEQQGEGIVDVTTHLVDLVQWECFPEKIIDYTKDIEMISAKRWTTEITPSQFEESTKLKEYPEYLKKDLKDSVLNVYANGEINYRINGICAKVSVEWHFKAPEGGGDTHFSTMRGSKCNLTIKQGADQNYKPVLYLEPVEGADTVAMATSIEAAVAKLQSAYAGLAVKKSGSVWEVVIPDSFKTVHEQHFGQVTEKYLKYLVDGKLPEWEVPNMIAKYYVTTKALEMAKGK